MKKRAREEECPQFPSWMTTFADLMSLLLTFFILLYSMSVINIQAFTKWISFFQGGREVSLPASLIPPPVIAPQVNRLALKMQSVLRKIHGYSAFQVMIGRNEVIIKFPGEINFALGDYKLKPIFKKALKMLIPVLKEIKGNYRIAIQGYASSIEKPKYPWIKDLWVLSAKRSTEVLRFLLSNGIKKEKLVAMAYGPLKPVYKGKNNELLKKNARVELRIIFYNQNYIKGQPPTKMKKIEPIPELKELLQETK